MSDRPQPPSADDLPEEMSIVEVPDAARTSSGKGSGGAMGILIAAVLGSVTAIGLFFVLKPYLVSPAPPEEKRPLEVSELETSANPLEESKQQQNSVIHNPGNPQKVATKSASEKVQSQSNVPEEEPQNVKTAQSDPTDEPFPGLNAKLNKVIPLGQGDPVKSAQEKVPQVEIVSITRHPKPSPDAVAQANSEIDAVFLSQIRNAKSREEKLLLTNALIKAANAEPEGIATRFGLKERALGLAIDAPDSELTNELISALTAEFEVEAYDYRLKAVDAWDRMKLPDIPGAAEQQLHRVLAQKAAVLGDLACQRNDYKTAATMYAIAGKRRNYANDKETADLFDKKRTAARTQDTRVALAVSLLSELEAKSEAPAGKQLEAGLACVHAGLWTEGLNCLAQGSDESLKNFAQQQRELRQNPQSSIRAGDHSWEAAQQLDRRHSVWLKRLAIADYEAAFTDLSPLQVQRLKPRIEQVGPVSCVWPEPLQHFAFEEDDFTRISKVNVLLNHMGHFGNGQLYGPQDLGLGIRGSALEFNGRDSMIVCPQTQDLILGESPFTFSFWIRTERPQDTVLAGRMYQHSSSIEPDFQLRLKSSGHLLAKLDPETGNEITLESSDSVTRNVWVHVAMTWDLHSLTLYLDGRKNSSLAAASSHSNLTLDNRAWIALGGEKPPNYRSSRFAGQMDEVRVYDQALSPLQIFHVYLKDQSTQR